MNKLLDKILIFLLCSTFYIFNVQSSREIIPLLIAITLSAALSYFEHKTINIIAFSIFLISCFYFYSFLFFLPLLCYDFLPVKRDIRWIFVILPFATHYHQLTAIITMLIICFVLLTMNLKHRTTSMETLKAQYVHLRDYSKENFLQIEMKNKELLEKQDYELNLATLSERNRIARDIHDNVGHLLSRSLLQVGALHATNKDESVKEDLKNIKDTLSSAMDSIRDSVHDLHEQSLDVHTEIQKIINQFLFCKIQFDYDVHTALDQKMKYCFIAVTKEALANIMRHSNATFATIIIREHPAFFQMIVQDNGTRNKGKDEQGIGLQNIRDRVMALGGNINISNENGFRIFITIHKKG